VSQRAIRVGVIGADTKSSWAKVSHIPAITGLPALKLAAVTTRNEESAREAAEAFGAERWFSDPFAMIRDDLIDIVTVAVKVPRCRHQAAIPFQGPPASLPRPARRPLRACSIRRRKRGSCSRR
jgi:Oxidoreductase family, NAD-binding Rossmann fold